MSFHAPYGMEGTPRQPCDDPTCAFNRHEGLHSYDVFSRRTEWYCEGCDAYCMPDVRDTPFAGEYELQCECGRGVGYFRTLIRTGGAA